MRFQVPQFTEVEDKIIGPLTFKQFIYLAGAVGMASLLFYLLPRFIAIVFALPVVGFGALLAFYKINGQPFIKVVESFVKYSLTGKLYLWKHERKAPSTKDKRPMDPGLVPKLSNSKLHDLMWSMDVNQSNNPVTGQEPGPTNT